MMSLWYFFCLCNCLTAELRLGTGAETVIFLYRDTKKSLFPGINSTLSWLNALSARNTQWAQAVLHCKPTIAGRGGGAFRTERAMCRKPPTEIRHVSILTDSYSFCRMFQYTHVQVHSLTRQFKKNEISPQNKLNSLIAHFHITYYGQESNMCSGPCRQGRRRHQGAA